MAKTSAKKPVSKKAAKVLEIHDTSAAVKGAEPFGNVRERGTPLIEMRDISIAFAAFLETGFFADVFAMAASPYFTRRE